MSIIRIRLLDVENLDGRIHLVFEYIDMTLTKYIANNVKTGGMPLQKVKVRAMTRKLTYL